MGLSQTSNLQVAASFRNESIFLDLLLLMPVFPITMF